MTGRCPVSILYKLNKNFITAGTPLAFNPVCQERIQNILNTRSIVNKKKSNSGFTLIELMIVVVIIGILAALAVPRFMAATTKNKQSEAKSILKQIYVNQRTYRQQGTGYWIPGGGTASATAPQAFAPIWVEIAGSARYTYTITGNANQFTATATSSILDDDATVDTWTIDHTGVITCVSDDAIS